MIDINSVLVPTDFSENSLPAIDYACELARRFDACLRVLHVVDDIGVYAMEMELGAYTEGGLDLLEAERRAAERLAKMEFPKDIEPRVHRDTLMGAPSEGICRFARENDVDLIVVSTHGRTGLRRLLMGSVAEHVVRRSPCPVLTVRPEGHQFVEHPDEEVNTTA